MIKEVRAGGRRARVIWRRGKIDPGSETFGSYEPDTNEIRIGPHQTPRTERETFLHEVLHQQFHYAGIVLPRGMEETVIELLTPWLLQVIQLNPEVIDYLMDEEA